MQPEAFLINRVGDFGFLLGIGLVLAYFGGSLRYQDVFAYLPNVQTATIQLFPGVEWSLITVTCLLLFVGAWVNRHNSHCTSGCLIRWRPDPDFCIDSRRNHGYRWSVYGIAYVADL